VFNSDLVKIDAANPAIVMTSATFFHPRNLVIRRHPSLSAIV
jgi:hypothetical protein